jgi:hypothetical protein
VLLVFVILKRFLTFRLGFECLLFVGCTWIPVDHKMVFLSSSGSDHLVSFFRWGPLGPLVEVLQRACFVQGPGTWTLLFG